MFTALATMALLAAPALVAATTGSAIVVNSCTYDVFLANTPSDDGVHTTDSKTLAPGGKYQQTWTELTNLAGWSIKLSLSATEWSSDIMQYEYTYQNDGIIWYDLSDVNGNPWNANWEITAESPSSTCSPLQQAYRYATDDAYGMQACADDSVITVTLCSGNTAAVSSVSSAAVVSSSAVAASSVASSTPVQTTTFATSTVATISAVTTNAVGSTTTNVKTATVTSVVTSTHWHHSHGARHATRLA
jgi:hypothetical protein